MKTPSLFKIGLILSIIGVIFVGYGFYEGEKISQTFLLDTEQTESIDLRLQDSGIGFYKISVPDWVIQFLFKLLILNPMFWQTRELKQKLQ